MQHGCERKGAAVQIIRQEGRINNEEASEKQYGGALASRVGPSIRTE